MAHGGAEKYYNPANKVVNDGDTAFADDVNNVNFAVDTALARVADDLDVMDVRVVALSAEAEAWAHNDQGIPPDPLEPTEFSSKAYATESKEYAIQAEGVPIHKADGTTQLIDSAYVSATKAAASQVAALASKNAAALSETNAEAHSLQAWADQQVGFESMQDAQAAASAAEDSADLAALSAANLPNATTAGANKILVTNSSGDGWDYVSQAVFGRKNLLDNGDFSVWQRGTSFNPSGAGIPVHTADRWRCINGPAVTSVTRQIFTQNSAAGLFYTSYVYRATFAGSYSGVKILSQFVEGLPRFLGKTVTLSFYARSSIASGSIYVQRELYYGDEMPPADGAPSIGIPVPQGNLTTSWVRYSATFTIPDGTAKTTTEPDHGLRLNIVTSVSGGYVEVAKVQLEYGNAATDFEEVLPAVNLMRCQRFYEKATVFSTWAQYSVPLMQITPITYSTPKRTAIVYPYCEGMDFYGTTGTLTNVNTWRSAARGIAPVIKTEAAIVGRAGLVYFTWIADAEPDSMYTAVPSNPNLTTN